MAEASGYTNEQEISKINSDLNWIKIKVMNTLTDNIPYIENCMMTTYVRNGKLIVEILDGRTVDIMRREKQHDEANRQKQVFFTVIIILCHVIPVAGLLSFGDFSIRVLPHTSY